MLFLFLSKFLSKVFIPIIENGEEFYLRVYFSFFPRQVSYKKSFLNYREKQDQFFVPTFDTKVTEYLCSGWVFFFRQISTFQLAIFDGIFYIIQKVLLF